MRRYSTSLAALTLAGALAFVALPSTPGVSAPLSASAFDLGNSVPNHVESVQWRGRRNGGAVAAGVAAGIIGGAAAVALAPRYYDGYDYGPGYAPAYGYGAPAYEPDYNSGYYYGDTRTRYQRQRDRNSGD